LIAVYKVLSGKYVSIQMLTAEVSFTRGNKYKIFKDSFRLDIRKYSLSSRIVNIWNSLPDYFVDVDSVDLFKTYLILDDVGLEKLPLSNAPLFT